MSFLRCFDLASGYQNALVKLLAVLNWRNTCLHSRFVQIFGDWDLDGCMFHNGNVAETSYTAT